MVQENVRQTIVIAFLVYVLYRVVLISIKRINRRWWYRNIYLHSWHWKITRWAKRMQVRVMRGMVMCEKCRSTKRLQVHHKTYERLGHEKMSDLKLLCNSCHGKEHNK